MQDSPRWLLLAGAAIVLLGLNLRIAISSLGVVLRDVQRDLDISTPMAAVLTSMPVLCFATIGLGVGTMLHRLRVHRASVLVLGCMLVALLLRAVTGSATVFFAGTLAVLCAISVGNVLAPVLAKLHFPDRIPLISALYGAAVIGGSTIGALGAGFLHDFLGWRMALGAAAFLTAVALLPCWRLLSVDQRRPAQRTSIPLRDLLANRYAWLMALCFGIVSAQAYAQLGWFPTILADTGLSTTAAGVMFGVLTATGIPTTLALPRLRRRMGHGPRLPSLFGTATAVGWAGILIAPTQLTWLWSALIGFGAGMFAWTLGLIGEHTRSAEGTGALSGFTQGIGYIVAALGPFGVGLAHDLTGAWTVPLLYLIALALALAFLGAAVNRPWTLEDTIKQRHPHAVPPSADIRCSANPAEGEV